MGALGPDPSPSRTNVLLVETDSTTREQHVALLEYAGYQVQESAGLPSPDELDDADLIIADALSFNWLQHEGIADRAVVVIAEDPKSGIMACLCGATDWVPASGSREYFLDVVKEATSRRRVGPW
jgi:hypothetical protein